jgi:hypothetical protein
MSTCHQLVIILSYFSLRMFRAVELWIAFYDFRPELSVHAAFTRHRKLRPFFLLCCLCTKQLTRQRSNQKGVLVRQFWLQSPAESCGGSITWKLLLRRDLLVLLVSCEPLSMWPFKQPPSDATCTLVCKPSSLNALLNLPSGLKQGDATCSWTANNPLSLHPLGYPVG